MNGLGRKKLVPFIIIFFIIIIVTIYLYYLVTVTFQTEPRSISSLFNLNNPSNVSISIAPIPSSITREMFGRSTWTMLHTLASSFPISLDTKPSEQVEKFKVLLLNLIDLFPCEDCANHFREMLKNTPMDGIVSRDQLEVWLCERHNEVNKRLQKNVVNCTVEALREKWRMKHA